MPRSAPVPGAVAEGFPRAAPPSGTGRGRRRLRERREQAARAEVPTAIAISLLLGQLNPHARSIRGELRAIGRLQASLWTADAVASSLRPEVVIDRLLERSVAAVETDRALLCRVEDGTIVIEGCRAMDAPVPVHGEIHPLSSSPIIQAAVRERRIQVGAGPIAPTWLSIVRGHRVGASRHALAVPLMDGHEVVGVLVLARIRDAPFAPDDLAAVGTIATVAALALRNAQQFAMVEAVGRRQASS